MHLPGCVSDAFIFFDFRWVAVGPFSPSLFAYQSVYMLLLCAGQASRDVVARVYRQPPRHAQDARPPLVSTPSPLHAPARVGRIIGFEPSIHRALADAEYAGEFGDCEDVGHHSLPSVSARAAWAFAKARANPAGLAARESNSLVIAFRSRDTSADWWRSMMVAL